MTYSIKCERCGEVIFKHMDVSTLESMIVMRHLTDANWATFESMYYEFMEHSDNCLDAR